MRSSAYLVLTPFLLSISLTALSTNRSEELFSTNTRPPLVVSELPGSFKTTATQLEAHITNESGFLKKIEMLERAQEGSEVDLAYFIYENDFSSSYFSQKLMTTAARKNLKIRLLVDYFMATNFKDTLAMLDANPHIEVRLFRPPTQKLFDLLKSGLQLPHPELLLEGMGETKILQALQESPYVMTRLSEVQKMIGEMHQSKTPMDPHLLIPQLLHGIEINDVKLALALRQEFTLFTQRLHHKLMSVTTAHGVEFINGGRNISDEYNLSLGHPFLRDRSYPFFDAEVSGLLKGDAATAMQLSFEKLWSSDLAVPTPPTSAGALNIQQQLLAQKAESFEAAISDLARKAQSGRMDLGTKPIVYSENGPQANPSAKDIAMAWQKALDGAQDQVTIISAYFYFTPEMQAAAERATQRGVKIDIYTNSFTSTDMNMVNLGVYQALSGWQTRLGNNLRIFELNKGPREGSLHAKVMSIDQTLIGIGSANTDPRTQLYDTNNLTLIDLSENSLLAQQFINAYLPGGSHQLSWSELTPEKAKIILEKAAQQNKKLLKTLKAPDVIRQL